MCGDLEAAQAVEEALGLMVKAVQTGRIKECVRAGKPVADRFREQP